MEVKKLLNLDRFLRIFGAYNTGSGDDHICARIGALVDIFRSNTTVHLNVQLGVIATKSAHLFHHIRHKFLTYNLSNFRHIEIIYFISSFAKNDAFK